MIRKTFAMTTDFPDKPSGRKSYLHRPPHCTTLSRSIAQAEDLVKGEHVRIVGKKQCKPWDRFYVALIMPHSPHRPRTMVDDVIASFGGVGGAMTSEVCLRLVRKEPLPELSYRRVMSNSAYQLGA